MKTKIELPPLKPCPFCGAPAELYDWEPDPEMCTGFGAFKRHGVRCSKCHANGPFTEKCFDEGLHASELWNGRSS